MPVAPPELVAPVAEVACDSWPHDANDTRQGTPRTVNLAARRGLCLDEAVAGGDTIDVAVPLRLVLSLEGIPCQPQ
jgi:hypothetical protein